MENKKKKTAASKAVEGKKFEFKSKKEAEPEAPKRDTTKKKATYYLETNYIQLIEAMSKYHGISQGEIIQRAMDKSVPDRSKYEQKREDF